MSRTCTICTHPDKEEIDRLLLSGSSYRDIAGRFGTSKSAVERHKADHIPLILCKARDEFELDRAGDLWEQLHDLRERALNLLTRAEDAEDLRSAGIFLRELREQLKLLAELDGKLATQPQINILMNPQWLELRAVIVQSLEGFPEAREALVNALHGR